MDDLEKDIYKMVKSTWDFTKEDQMKGQNIRCRLIFGERVYYKKCDKCGENYYCNALKECPHMEKYRCL